MEADSESAKMRNNYIQVAFIQYVNLLRLVY